AASFLGGAIGAYLSTRFSNKVIKQCFEILTLLVGLKLLL
ncbi:MAG TPA: permease, partial [Vibrio sp.]|nr:permease [Vibrio sp.]